MQSSLGLPIDLVLVRHGESEGNLAQSYSKKGDDRFWTAEFKLRPTSEYRLTDQGREQAVVTGNWLRKTFPSGFDMYYCSEYARAMETAALLRIEKAQWNVEFFLRERSRGALHGKSYIERKKNHSKMMEAQSRACARVDLVLEKLRQSCSGLKVLIVAHGNIMEAFRIRLEKWTQEQYKEYKNNKNPYTQLHYGHVLHYTRRDPHTGEIRSSYNWCRSTNPSDMSLCVNKFKKFKKRKFTNADLFASISKIPQLVNNDRIDCKITEIETLEHRLKSLRKDIVSATEKRKHRDTAPMDTTTLHDKRLKDTSDSSDEDELVFAKSYD